MAYGRERLIADCATPHAPHRIGASSRSSARSHCAPPHPYDTRRSRAWSPRQLIERALPALQCLLKRQDEPAPRSPRPLVSIVRHVRAAESRLMQEAARPRSPLAPQNRRRMHGRNGASRTPHELDCHRAWFVLCAVLLATAMGPLALAQQQPPARPQRLRCPSAKAVRPGTRGAPAGDAALAPAHRAARGAARRHAGGDRHAGIAGARRHRPGARRRRPASPGPAAAIGAADAGRLDGIETQISALAAQLEQLQEQVRALAGRSGALPPAASPGLQRSGAGAASRPARRSTTRRRSPSVLVSAR